MEINPAIENCFVLPVNQKFMVYNPLVGISALLNKAGVKELYNQLRLISENIGNPESDLFELAQDILQTPLQFPEIKKGILNPEFLGIIPTRTCNGACNYCDFGAETAPSEKMSYQLAANIVDWYAGVLKSQERKIFEVHFFGGEPMITRDIIEVIVHRTRLISKEQDLLPFFEISTNGQYSKSDARFLGKYFNKVILSLDGFKEVQNKHRPLKDNKSSYENVIETAKIVSDSHAELCIRCCVSKLNVNQMEEITHWFCQNFRLSAINFEMLCATAKTESKGLFPPDPVDFAVHFQHAKATAQKYGVQVVYASDISNNPQWSSCPVGKDTVIVSPDGRISNCYLMPERWKEVNMELDFGFLHSKKKADIDEDRLEDIRKMVEEKPRCQSCFCQWSCAGGCHVGNTFPGCSMEYDDFCKQTRIISAFTLLSNLDRKENVEELINSVEALDNLANQKSDKIEAFSEFEKY